MTDVSSVIEQLWGMFIDFFYLTLKNYDQIVILRTFDGQSVSLLDFCVTVLVLAVVLSVVLGIRYSVPSQNDLL